MIEVPKAERLRADIAAFVREHPDCTTADVAAGVTGDPGSIRATVAAMVRAGQIGKRGVAGLLSAGGLDREPSLALISSALELARFVANPDSSEYDWMRVRRTNRWKVEIAWRLYGFASFDQWVTWARAWQRSGWAGLQRIRFDLDATLQQLGGAAEADRLARRHECRNAAELGDWLDREQLAAADRARRELAGAQAAYAGSNEGDAQ